jgi:D-alanyl-D-alanine carboxypeptidase/D-alanyl-D-alanine-endopeptidase (penicillin-binding protein 4)
VDRILERPELRTSTCGVVVARCSTGEVIYEHGAARLLAPASNTKIVSAAGALAVLGKDFRFETPVVAAGPVRDGVLEGDLVLVASGDPNLSQRIGPGGRLLFADKDHSYAGFYDAALVPGDPLSVLKDLARRVAEAGIVKVRGDVVVDDGLFDETDDDFVGGVSAACVNDNLIDVTIAPGEKPGDPARVEHQPRGSLVNVAASVTTSEPGAEADAWIEALDGAASFAVKGSVPAGARPILRVASFRKPALVAAGFLEDALRTAGIEVAGKARQARRGPAAYGDSRVIARHVSPPLSEALRVTMKVSHNLHATMLPLVVGALRGGKGDRRSGYRAIHRTFKQAGLDMDGVVLQSGSGGGRADSLSAGWIAGFLRHLAAREDFPVFLDALPVGGVDGTLANVFRDEVFAGRVRAKTGTLVYRGTLNDRWIYLSKSLSGYLDLRSEERPGDLLVFSILMANTIAESRKQGADDLFRAQEDILRAVIEGWQAVARQ